MGKALKVRCPAKINLTLKVINKREDGFHNIESIMQTINLYDYLTIKVSKSDSLNIKLDGNNCNIPYNENNLVYKAIKLYLENVSIQPHKISVYIEKNIPVSAGLAGGSTDAAGVLFGLNELFDNLLSIEKLHGLCASLGSDLNVCLKGGKLMTRGRGEIIEPMNFQKFRLSLIKPINLGISAKEAYTKFSKLFYEEKININNRDSYLNDLEWAVINDYEQLKKIKTAYPKAVMSGSGSSYFLINGEFKPMEGYWICNNLEAIDYGVSLDSFN